MVARLLWTLAHSFASKTCPVFVTKELPREAVARQRRQAQQSRTHSQGITAAPSHPAQTRQPKVFNLQTYKLHALADYPSQIKMYGTTDSYSTQSVSTVVDHAQCLEINSIHSGRT